MKVAMKAAKLQKVGIKSTQSIIAASEQATTSPGFDTVPVPPLVGFWDCEGGHEDGHEGSHEGGEALETCFTCMYPMPEQYS
jgi:hypothetical protein